MAVVKTRRDFLVAFGKYAFRFAKATDKQPIKADPLGNLTFRLYQQWPRPLLDQTVQSRKPVFRRKYITLKADATHSRHSNCRTPTVAIRPLATGASSSVASDTADTIIRSHLPNIDLPNISFHEYMFGRCDLYKDLPAVTDYMTGRSHTYSQIKEKAVRVASALHRLGYRKGHVFLSFTTNHMDISILMLACSCLGIWYSAANPSFTAGELTRQLSDSDCVAVFTIPQLAAIVGDALNSMGPSHKVKRVFVFGESPGLQPFQSLLDDDGKSLPDVDINPMDDVYVLPYSSGTTGLPKGVMLTHHNIVANCLQMRESLGTDVGERTLGLLPLFHIYGMVVIQYGVMQGGGQVILLQKFEPEIFLTCLQNTKIQMAYLVPALVTFLAKHPAVSDYDVTCLRRVVSGAAPLGQDVTREFLQRHTHGVTLSQGYGMTEMSPITNVDATFRKEGSVGTLVVNTLGKIIDTETKKTLGPNQPGEYCVKGPQVMKGYFRNPAATKSMITQDGWLHTGDVAYFKEDGSVYIKDRVKELIKYKGFQVSPAELEALLLGHDDINDVAVIGVPDQVAGELPRAFVVTKPLARLSQADVVKFVEGNMAPSKWLRGGVQFVEAIPRNPSGKILRRILKEVYVEGQVD